MAQAEDKYFYATVWNQECVLYVFQQYTLTNEHYYKQFNTEVDAGEAIVITRQYRVVMEDTA